MVVPALDCPELAPADGSPIDAPAARLQFVNTLADPTTIAVDASEHRAAVATRVGVLSVALDTAVTAGAKNSIEKMLCHQIAATHMAGMELLVRLGDAWRLVARSVSRTVCGAFVEGA